MLLEVKNVGFCYEGARRDALDDVSIGVDAGEFVGVAGVSGSGKSTLMRMLNGLLRPSRGTVLFDGGDIWRKGYDVAGLRREVGLVFQKPERQLFCETVLEDVAFGARQTGSSEEEARQKAERSLGRFRVPSELWGRSPQELSGGLRRRVAIAGIAAMEPRVLVLDEPMAGLDPQTRAALLDELEQLRAERGCAVVLVSHRMEDIAAHAGRMYVLDHGSCVLEGAPRSVFSQVEALERLGIGVPVATFVTHALYGRGLPLAHDGACLSAPEATEAIAGALAACAGAARGGESA